MQRSADRATTTAATNLTLRPKRVNESGERTWPDRLSIRHSDLRKRTTEEPLIVRFKTGVIPSVKRKDGSTYIAFYVQGDAQTYTYQPENDHVRAYLEVVAGEQHRQTWYELRADGRDDTARISVIPLQRPSKPGGYSRQQWGDLHETIRERYFEIFGHLPDPEALKVAMLAFADAEEARRIAAQVRPAAAQVRRAAA